MNIEINNNKIDINANSNKYHKSNIANAIDVKSLPIFKTTTSPIIHPSTADNVMMPLEKGNDIELE